MGYSNRNLMRRAGELVAVMKKRMTTEDDFDGMDDER